LTVWHDILLVDSYNFSEITSHKGDLEFGHATTLIYQANQFFHFIHKLAGGETSGIQKTGDTEKIYGQIFDRRLRL